MIALSWCVVVADLKQPILNRMIFLKLIAQTVPKKNLKEGRTAKNARAIWPKVHPKEKCKKAVEEIASGIPMKEMKKMKKKETNAQQEENTTVL